MNSGISGFELWHNADESWLSKGVTQLNQSDEILVKSHYSLISLGTERLLTSQQLSKETANKMRVPYMKGDFGKDFTYGYSVVGEVIEGPSSLKNKLVHVMHPHQNVLAVKQKDVSILPDGLDPKVSSLASNMETAINAIWDSQIQIGDSILVIGYGIIGALISRLAQKVTGVDVTILEQEEHKKMVASNAGHLTFSQDQSNFDVVFNTSSSEDMLQKAIKLTRQEGKIIEVSWYGERKINIMLGADFHYGRKQIICSQVSEIPHQKQPVWNHKKRKCLVLKLLKELNPIDLIELEVPFTTTPVFFEKLRKGTINHLGVIIKY